MPLENHKNPFSFQRRLTQDFYDVFFTIKKPQKTKISYITVIRMFENVKKRQKVKVGFVTPLYHCALVKHLSILLNASDGPAFF